MSRAKLAPMCVGTKYVSRFGDGSSTPWLDDAVLKKRLEQNRFRRWDGVEATAQEHGQWMLAEARSLLSDARRGEYRPYGSRNGCRYFIHDALTAAGEGSAFVKIEGRLALEPRDMVAWMFDLPGLRDADETIVLMKVLETYAGPHPDDPFTALVYWANAPGFPFAIRDNVDISGYQKDDDGTVWQFSTSVPGDIASQPGAIKGTDRYWAYKLVPAGNGQTDVTLICQTLLHGNLPKFVANRMVCRVLIDYMTTIVRAVEKKKASGEHAALIAQLDLGRI